MPGDLDEPMLLHTAERYVRAQNAAALLPQVYGDFLDPNVLPADLQDGGPLPTVYIDTDNWVFLMNNGPVPPQSPQLYKNDTLIEPIAANGSPVYTFNPGIDYAGVGHIIAGVIFFTDPGTENITWRGRGTTDGVGGPMITNPISGFFHAFAKYGQWTLEDFDLAIGMETLRTLETYNVKLQWCFWQQRTYREWLNEILRCFHVDYGKTHEGKLAIQLDRAIYGLPTQVLSTIDADLDLDGDADTVEFEVDQVNIVNTLLVRRRLKWTDMVYTDWPTIDFPISVNLYGELRGEVDLPACYSDAHGIAWLQAFFLRYGLLPAIIRFTVRGLGHLTDLPGTYVGFVNAWYGWEQARLLKVLNQEVDPNDGSPRIHFECFDCGRFVNDQVTMPVLPAIRAVRTRPRTSIPTVDLIPPGPASALVATGSYRRVVLRWTVPGDLDYYHTEIWASQTNNRATATHVRNGGILAPPGGTCEETFEVTEGQTWYVWLMTVDHTGNGQNGGQGATGGNWYPASPTAGTPAASTLIQTPGIAPQAVSVTYHAPSGFAGVTIGVTVLAYRAAAISPTTGYFDMKGVSIITIPANCTLIHEIREGSATGEIHGQQVVPNTLASQGTYPFSVFGRTSHPVWGGLYGTVATVIDVNGANVAFTVTGSGFELIHVKL